MVGKSGDVLLAQKLQAREVAQVVRQQNDFEMAFRLQMAEALRSSRKACARDDHDSSDESGSDNEALLLQEDEDRQIALKMQAKEVHLLNQEMDGAGKSNKKVDQLREIPAIWEHNAIFAQFLDSVPKDEWRRNWGNRSDPYMEVPSKKRRTMDEATTSQKPPKQRMVGFAPDMCKPALAAGAFGIEGASRRDRKRDTFVCQICLETKKNAASMDECGHQFCLTCSKKHADITVQKGKSHVACPQVGCPRVWSERECKRLLSKTNFEIMTRRQVVDALPESERIYCPYPNCSALQLLPQFAASTSRAPARSSAVDRVQCVTCNELFCLQCRVQWHSGMTCREFQSMKQDQSFLALAKKKEWQRCRKCQHMVELTEGCVHIKCRCGHEFCYKCGEKWKTGHTCKT